MGTNHSLLLSYLKLNGVEKISHSIYWNDIFLAVSSKKTLRKRIIIIHLYSWYFNPILWAQIEFNHARFTQEYNYINNTRIMILRKIWLPNRHEPVNTKISCDSLCKCISLLYG